MPSPTALIGLEGKARKALEMWEPIQDLPEDFTSISDGELAPLLQFWTDLRNELNHTGQLERFQAELAREWAIETGQIEGIYDVDRGVTATLIERGIEADLIPHVAGQKQPELIAAIIRDHLDVLEGLFSFVKGERPLSKGYINELHAALLRNQTTATVVDQFGRVFETEILKGHFKQRPNNPTRADGTVHLYCPPDHIESEMERLVAMHSRHELIGVPVEVQAAWLHHRFTQIHPYQDGNGRVARALGSLLFLKAGWFPIVVTREDRVRYIDALEVADEGDLRSLTAFFVDVQKRTLFQATKAAAEIMAAKTVAEAITSAKRVLIGAAQTLEPSVWLRSKGTADHVLEIADASLAEIKSELDREIGTVRGDFTFSTSDFSASGSVDLGFAPNPGTYHRVSTLMLRQEQTAHFIGVQAYGIGTKFRGLIGIVVIFTGTEKRRVALASEEPFQVNYAESQDNAERRFRPWLERSLTRALTLWRQSL